MARTIHVTYCAEALQQSNSDITGNQYEKTHCYLWLRQLGLAGETAAVIDLPGPATVFSVSPRSLKLLAAILWYSGALVLLTKGLGLFTLAIGLQGGWLWPAAALASALLFGSLKVHYIFKPGCRKNLQRIAGLHNPRLWQFYRPGFFLFLCAMIVLGRYLSNSVQGSYAGLLAVATLDLSLAIALLGSSSVFWQAPTQPDTQTGDQSRR